MQQMPINTPMIMESLRRLDFIMPIKLFMPGIVPSFNRQDTSQESAIICLPITWNIRWLILVSEARWLANSERVSYACLFASVNILRERMKGDENILQDIIRHSMRAIDPAAF